MGAWEFFPYSNFHDLNLDFIIRKIKELELNQENVGKAIKEAIKELIDDGDIEAMVNAAVAAYTPTTKLYTQMVRNDEIEDYALQSLAQYNNDVLLVGFSNEGRNTNTDASDGMVMAVSIKKDATFGKLLATNHSTGMGHNGSVAVVGSTAYFKDSSQNQIWPVTYAGGAVSIGSAIPLTVGWGSAVWICGDSNGAYMVCESGGDYRLYDLDVTTGMLSNGRTMDEPPYITKQRQSISVKGDRLYWCNGSSGFDVYAIRDDRVEYVRSLNLQDDPSGVWDMGELEIVAPSITDDGGFWIGSQFYLPVGTSNVSNRNFMRQYTIAYANAISSVIGTGTQSRTQMRDITGLTLAVNDDGVDWAYQDGTSSTIHPFKTIAGALYFAQSVGCRNCRINVYGNHKELAVEINDVGPNVYIYCTTGATLQIGQVEVVGRLWIENAKIEYLQINYRGQCHCEKCTIADVGYTASEIPLDNYDNNRSPAYSIPCIQNTGGIMTCFEMDYTGNATDCACLVWHGGIMCGTVSKALTNLIQTRSGGKAFVAPKYTTGYAPLITGPMGMTNKTKYTPNLPEHGKLRFVIKAYGTTCVGYAELNDAGPSAESDLGTAHADPIVIATSFYYEVGAIHRWANLSIQARAIHSTDYSQKRITIDRMLVIGYDDDDADVFAVTDPAEADVYIDAITIC